MAPMTANRLPAGFELFAEAQQEKFLALKKVKDTGGRVVGIYCSFVPVELIYAAKAVPVSLCATNEKPISAAERDLPRNLCPLIKASYGYALTDTCPFFYFSDFIVGETTCDGKKKMFELLNTIKPTHVMQLPQNNQQKEGFTFWADEIRKLKKVLEDFYALTITEEDIRDAIKLRNWERRNLVDFFELSALEPPPVSGLEQYNVNEAFGFQYDIQKKNEELIKRTKELKDYWLTKLKGTKDNRPRILITGCPLGGVKEKILKTIEELGAVIVGYDSCSGLRTHMQYVDEDSNRDPIDALAEKYLSINCSVMSPNPGRLTDIDYLIEHYRPNAIIECTLTACHTFNIEACIVAQHAKKRGLPYMHIESDYSQQDKGQFATRLEAFMEILAGKK